MDDFVDVMPQHQYLRSKFKVGSCQTDRVNHRRKDKVFHAGDVPRRAAEMRKEVQRSTRPDVLGLARSAWDQSTVNDPKVEKPPPRRNLRNELLQIRGRQADQPTMPTTRESDEKTRDFARYVCAITGKGPVGAVTKTWFNAVDQRGLGAHCVEPTWPDWNCSVNTRAAEDVKVKEKRFAEFEERCKAQNKPDRLLSYHYRPPEVQISEMDEMIRQKKLEYQDLKEEFKTEIRRDHPQVTEERLQAMAARLLDEKLLHDERIRRYPIPHESFRPNLAMTTADRRYKEWSHPGKWELNEQDGLFAWSCCMHYSENSKGCEYTTVNPDKWCYLAGGAGRC
jgi:hypothetical protein